LTTKDSDMGISAHRPAVTRPGIDTLRRTSLTAGVLYLITFVSIPTLALYQGVHDRADFVLGAGSDTGVLWGALSEVVVAIAGIGTAVVLFPVAKRQSETAALGFLTSRVVEGCLIIVGVVGVLSIVSLRHAVAGTAGADRASLVTTGHTLSAVYDNAFLLSQSLAPVVNACCLGYVMYRSGLVPRILPIVGFIGVPLLLAADIAVFFGVIDRTAPINALAALPIALWEFSLGMYLTFRGFKPTSPLLAPPKADAGIPSPIPSPRTGADPLDARGAAIS
jgi:Domain of unknown function (DUF4386)